MKNFSNRYIYIFSAVMVIVVAALLSTVALTLKSAQDRNVREESMQSILKCVRVKCSRQESTQLFKKYIVDSYVVNDKGDKVPGVKALEVNMPKEYEKIAKIKGLKVNVAGKKVTPFKKFMAKFIHFSASDQSAITNKIANVKSTRLLPVYVCQKDTSKYYILPLRGKGLWGPIWGYIALQSDLNTVYGAVFDDADETPGLGAQISQSWFQKNFVGKKIFDNKGNFTSIEVVKGGAPPTDIHGVDAISGGTITSKGVQAMLYDCLSSYVNFIDKLRK